MFQDAINGFTHNMFALRDFVTVISPFLDQQHKELVKEQIIDMLPFTLALKELEPERMQEVLDKKTSQISLALYRKRYGGDITVEAESVPDGGKRVSLKMNDKGSIAFAKAMKAYQISHLRKDLLYQSSLMTLISTVEWFFCQVLRVYFEKHPDAIGADDRMFSLKDLRTFGSIQEEGAPEIRTV